MLEDKVFDTIKQYNLIEKDDIVLVAVSGGPDSMCLLNTLKNLKETLQIKKLAVAHVNHMLREEAESETQYVKQYCEKNNIEIFIKYANIKQISAETKMSEETAGREERYKFFNEIANKINANKIAIAHNLNDNTETVLMHLLRGTGISGLVGIKPNREGKFIRPIIKCNRAEVEDYCKKEKLNPKYDKTNNDNTYTRNKIRNELIPYIKKEFNPNIIETISRLSELVLIEDTYMNSVTKNSYKDICIKEEKDKITIDLKKFNRLDIAIKTRIILFIVKKIFGDSKGIEKVHLYDIIKLCDNNIGNKFLKPNKNLKVFIKSGEVSYEKVLK